MSTPVVEAEEQPQGQGSARQTALEEHGRWAAEVQRWRVVRDTAERDAEALEERSGRELVDGDEGTAERLAAERDALRGRAAMAQKAAVEAQSRADVARRDALLAEAAELDEPIAQARAAVEAHEARAGRLLKALEGFTGAQFVQRSLDDAITRAARGEQVSLPIPKVQGLHRALERLQVAQELLRAAAAGEDLRQAVPRAYAVDPWSGPWFRFEDLPESLRPGGLAPAPGFTAPADDHDPVAAAEEAVAEVEAAMLEQQRLVDLIVDGRASEDYATRRRYMDSDLALEERRLREAKSKWHTAKGVRDRARRQAGS
jgi:hypothetical protein